ncbi:hypothetical protein DFJ73DRAFT_801515 [Zopfochytrium polystomum]|nr:hypothetical protein DFJ73DRAFT_801515 [Zopfochytrium polystomum]
MPITIYAPAGSLCDTLHAQDARKPLHIIKAWLVRHSTDAVGHNSDENQMPRTPARIECAATAGLILAADTGRPDLAELFIERGASIDGFDPAAVDTELRFSNVAPLLKA